MKHIFYVFLLIVLFFSGNCFADDGWTINSMVYGVLSFPSVAVDIDNRPIVAFSDAPDMKIIKQTAAGYEVNEIADVGGAWPRLQITSNNELALSFVGLSMNGIYYASKGSWFDWVFSKVDSMQYAAYPDMALTANDIPHIAYGVQGYIYHAFYDVHSQQWIKEQLSGFGEKSHIYYVNLETDSAGKVIISASTDDEVLVTVYSDGFWNYLPPLETYNMKSDCSFAADSKPAVAFQRNDELIYAVYINDIIGWVETVAAPMPSPGSYFPDSCISLEHSSTGIPGIAYVDMGSFEYHCPVYATNVSGGWTATQIDEKGCYVDLIFDRNDKPLIAYTGYDECFGVPVLKLAGIGLEGFNITDLNNDKIVNFRDFAVMAEHWMTVLPEPDLTAGDFNQDAVVNTLDLKRLGCNWLWQWE
ncbi:MAG: dockerin type I domain-containing protein [Phycisphaerae bacterium]|nr:dockerin type I domain-containing protein [Phycisphaerae bacterium]